MHKVNRELFFFQTSEGNGMMFWDVASSNFYWQLEMLRGSGHLSSGTSPELVDQGEK